MEENEYLRAAIFEIIENQIEDNNPKETKETLDRLISEGYSHEDAMKYIGCVVSNEVFEVLKKGRKFDEKSFINALKRLPTLPWE